ADRRGGAVGVERADLRAAARPRPGHDLVGGVARQVTTGHPHAARELRRIGEEAGRRGVAGAVERADLRAAARARAREQAAGRPTGDEDAAGKRLVVGEQPAGRRHRAVRHVDLEPLDVGAPARPGTGDELVALLAVYVAGAHLHPTRELLRVGEEAGDGDQVLAAELEHPHVWSAAGT